MRFWFYAYAYESRICFGGERASGMHGRKDVLSVMDNRSGLFCGLWEGLTGEFVVSGFLGACYAG